MLAELAGLRQDAAMDFAAAGLLEGLEGDEREARCRLLERLAEEGFTLDELRSAVQEDRLSLLLVERVLGGSYTIAEVAERTGLPASVRRGMIGRVERESGTLGSEQQLTVCFADLVGFTRLGGQVEARELGSVAGTLAELAADLAESPVRLVKTIGDAAMFVSQEPGQQVAVALSLVEAVEEADLPALRAGVACGPALLRSGDYYGNAVNVASRVTGIARPGSVLCTQEVRDAAPEDFDWSFAGKHRLRGVSRSVALHRARRLGSNAEKGAKRQTADRRRKRASS